MEPYIWLRTCGDNYEYVAVHVDNLLIASKDSQSVLDALTNKHHFKLKVWSHLGCDFGRHGDGTLHFIPRGKLKR